MDGDQLRAEMAEAMHAKDCACGKTMYADHHTPEVPEWYAEMADAALRAVAPTLEGLKANQLPDGGQWLQRDGGWMVNGEFQRWISGSFAAPTHRRRVWTGPVEPIGRGGDPTQPAAPRPVVDDVTSTGPGEGDRSGVEGLGPQNRSEGVESQEATGRYQFAEPDNNCFIPRRRDWPESREKLQQAAHWYGGRFVPGAEAEPQ